MALEPSLLRGSLGGWVASVYSVLMGMFEAIRGDYRVFSSPSSASYGIVFGIAGLILLFLLWRRANRSLRRPDNEAMSLVEAKRYLPFQFGRNLCILFALVSVVLVFLSGGPPAMPDIIRLVFQLVLIWIVYSSLSFLMKKIVGTEAGSDE